MEHPDDLQEDFSALYWSALYEFKQRRFSFVERRLAEKINDLTYGRSKSDVAIPSVQDLADAIPCLRSNLIPVIERLVGAQILGRDERLKTWWLNEIDLWKRLECVDGSDPDCAQSAVAATARIIAHDQRRARQREMFPEVTDAEVQAEAGRARAAAGLATGLSPSLEEPPPAPSIFQTNGGPDRLKNRRPPSIKQTNEAPIRLKNRRSASYLDAGAPASAQPGNQVKESPGNPGKPGSEKTAGRRFVLSAAGYRLLDELEDFGGTGTAEQREDWMWRIHHRPGVVERALREVQAIVRESRELVRSRTGYVKKLFRDWSGETPDSQPAPVPPAAPVEAEPVRAPAAETVADRAAEQETETEAARKRQRDALQLWREKQRRGMPSEDLSPAKREERG